MADKIRCNNCYKIFHSEDELKIMEDKEGTAELKNQGIDDKEFFKGCVNCNTDKYLMEV